MREAKHMSKTIHIYPENTTQGFYYPSNNDESLKNIAFLFKDQSDVVFDGENAEYIFHGRISPIVIDNCKNVTIKNLTIDYERPFFTQAEIVESSDSRVLLRIPAEFPYNFGPNGLLFIGENWESRMDTDTVLIQEYDPATGAVAYNSPVLLVNIGETVSASPSASMPAMQLHSRPAGDGLVELTGPLRYTPKVGNWWLFSHENRENSGIFVVDSANVTIENVHIRHVASMGITAQCTENITLKNVTTLPAPGRMLSVNADSTHFINCSGLVKIEDCVFEKMLDDGVNIHGLYTRVESVSGNTVTLHYMHCQHRRADIYKPGDKLLVSRGSTREIKEVITVVCVDNTDPFYPVLTLASPVQYAEKGDLVENRDRMPEVEIRNTRVAHNRPRAFLVSTTRRALVEGCYMSNCHYGIHIAGDSTYWYESGGATDLTIRNNIFENCCHQAGEWPLGITPEYQPTQKEPYFHHNILIEGNEFRTFTDGILTAAGVDGLTVRNNRYVRTNAYPRRREVPFYDIHNCNHVYLEDPIRAKEK